MVHVPGFCWCPGAGLVRWPSVTTYATSLMVYTRGLYQALRHYNLLWRGHLQSTSCHKGHIAVITMGKRVTTLGFGQIVSYTHYHNILALAS